MGVINNHESAKEIVKIKKTKYSVKFRKFPDDYECWWNFLTLPRVNQNDPKYLDFITGEKGIAKKCVI